MTTATISSDVHIFPWQQTHQSVSRSYIARYADQISTTKQIKEFLDFVLKHIDTRPQIGKLSSILAELESLRVAEDDEDGYIFRSEPRASEKAKEYVITAYRIMRDDFPRPKIESDGEGGVILDWRRNGKIIRLACRAKPNQRDYIYHQFNDHHSAKDASESLLLYRLSWLMQDA
jgi:hypothetical protein